MSTALIGQQTVRESSFGHAKSPIANDWTTSDVSIIEVATAKVTPLANTPAAESGRRLLTRWKIDRHDGQR